MESDRSGRRLAWAREALQLPGLRLEPASSDASFRSYWRSIGAETSWIVMDAPPEREDVRPWLDVAARLRSAGLEAPEVRASNVEEGFLLLSDLGRDQFLPALRPDRVDALYASAMDALLTFATRVDARGLPPYDEARLVAEMELMPAWLVQRHLGVTPECEDWDVIESAFRVLVNNALEQPQVFVHRDFHSRNLMLPVAAGRGPGIIDFQDAVRGPVTYDLVSLLRDCYIVWPDAQVYAWVESYRQRLEHAGVARIDPARFVRWFDLMGLQRHIKVLGIFCRLWYRDGKAGYLPDLPRVWDYARRVGARYPEIQPMIALLQRWIGERDLTSASA